VGFARFFFIYFMTELVAKYTADAVARLAEPVLEEMGLELVEVQFRREQAGWILRLIIFRPSGVTVDDCAGVSREIGNLLDVEDLIEQHYYLEVSSPGLDRPLKTAKDFARYQGQKVKIVVKTPVEDQHEIVGSIAQVNENDVVVAAEDKQIQVQYELIAKAKLVIEF
jgi:ribosome maturation factor RimP